MSLFSRETNRCIETAPLAGLSFVIGILMKAVRHWRPLAYPAVLVLLGLAFALVPLLRGEIFFYWDNAHQHYAQTEFLQRNLRSGAIPQWWPDVGLGFPTVAEGQAAHYHPVRLLLALLFSTPVAFMLEIGIYLAVAGLSTHLFLREFGLQRPACLVGGLCQMFGSYSIAFIRNIAVHRSFFLLPLAMLFAERFVMRRKIAYGIAASFILGLQLLSGYPTFAIVTIVATAVHILCRMLQRSWHSKAYFRSTAVELGRAMCQWGLVVLLGFGIAAMQFLPMLLHVRQSIREGGLSFEYAVNSLTAKVQYLPQLFFPYVYEQGDWLKTPTAWGSVFNDVPNSGIYVGALAVVLATIALWWRRWPDPGWPLAVLVLVATGLALGSVTPLYPALWSLPGMNGVRYPGRFLMLASFGLACLAGLGLHRLLARSRLANLRKRDFVPFLLLAGSVLLFALFFWTQQTKIARIASLAQDFRSGVITSLVCVIVAFALTLGLLVIRRRFQGGVMLLIVIFVLADLWYFRTRSGYAPTVPIHDVLTPPPVVELLKKDPDQFRVMSLVSLEQGLNGNEDLREFLQADTCAIWGIESADVYCSLLLKRYYALHDGIVWESLNSKEAAKDLSGFLAALNVKYVLAPKAVTLEGWEKVHESTRVTAWKNPVFLPRAYLVDKVVPEHVEVRDEWFNRSTYERLERYNRMVSNWWTRLEDAQILDNVLSRPLDYRTTAVVAGNNLPELRSFDPDAEVRDVTQQADSMRFEVNTRSSAFLVISSNCYPGWTATLNGQPTEIHRTNYVAMGIAVPPGRSEVELRFLTPGFRLGGIVTFLSLSLAIAGLLTTRRVRLPSLGRLGARLWRPTGSGRKSVRDPAQLIR